MTVNFTSKQNSYKDLGQFRFWCQKVLPLVYDDSLSYYELLCKVVAFLNDTIDNLNLVEDDMKNLYESYNKLQSYVNEYFDSLDVQEEINNKLDQMAQDGTFDTYFDKYFGKYVDRLDVLINPCYSVNGKQIKKLKSDLCNPFVQDIRIGMLGDSVTWGCYAMPVGATEPRSGNSTDVRNTYESPCYVNLFKRWIANEFLGDEYETELSNYPTSPSGECYVTYSKAYVLAPQKNLFEFIPSEEGAIIDEAYTSSCASGIVQSITIAKPYNASVDINFNFTGQDFDILYTENPSDNPANVEIYVNDLKTNDIITVPATVVKYDAKLHVRLPYKVINGKITMRVVCKEANANYSFRFSGINVDKKIHIENDAIIGATANSLENLIKNYNLLINKLDYAFLMIGTNDRVKHSNPLNGWTVSGFKIDLLNLLNTLSGWCDNVVLMVSNPCVQQSNQLFTQVQVKNIISNVAYEGNYDFIDCYSCFDGYLLEDITTDNLHPNNKGHNIMFRNIANSIMQM